MLAIELPSYSYDLANRIREIRRGPLNQLLLKYTYTTGFVTQTDYGSGLRRTATINWSCPISVDSYQADFSVSSYSTGDR